MTTLYSAGVTVKGKKQRAVSFNMEYHEREAFRALCAPFAAAQGLKPPTSDLRCGTRVNKSYCTAIAKGLTGLLELKDDEVLLVDGADLKALQDTKKALDGIYENIKKNAKTAELSGEDVAAFVKAGTVFSAYANLGVDQFTINNNNVSRARVKELITFLNSVNRNVLLK